MIILLTSTAGRAPLRGGRFHAPHHAAARHGPSGFNRQRLRAVPALRTPFGIEGSFAACRSITVKNDCTGHCLFSVVLACPSAVIAGKPGAVVPVARCARTRSTSPQRNRLRWRTLAQALGANCAPPGELIGVVRCGSPYRLYRAGGGLRRCSMP